MRGVTEKNRRIYMVEKTRSVDKISISDELMSQIRDKKKVEMLGLVFEKLIKEIHEILNVEGVNWIEIKNIPLYYVTSEEILVIDIKRARISSTGFSSWPGFSMGGMDLKTANNLFTKNSNKNPLLKNGLINYTDLNGQDFFDRCYLYLKRENSNGEKTYDWRNGELRLSNWDYFHNKVCPWEISDIDSVKLPVYYLTNKERNYLTCFFIEKNLNIFSDKQKSECFELFSKLLNNRMVSFNGNSVKMEDSINTEELLEYIDSNNNNIMGVDFSEEKVLEYLAKEKISKDSEVFKSLLNQILSCDETRIHMEKYPQHILKDPESGHWELWCENNEKNVIQLEEKLVARNPVYDALNNRSGVVGIDFGTKSTVVTYRGSRADVMPMRIGSGQYAREISMDDYENPTVMELRDICKFLSEYRQQQGRPLTHWNDLLISHEAFAQLKDEQRSGDTFATFFSELKQWASDKERQVTLRDAKGVEVNIPPYMNLKEDDFDPIEIYAYYIGLFINNLIHKIYLRYKLSFPAKIEKSVRDKILYSFEKGIRKSLPEAVLENEECMKIFRVEQGASEPAAYAICALQEYEFDPEDDEKVYYGIFDFGGGTTDFDFGIWSSEEDDDNYDYKISRFGEGEDPYLGGENLLSVLAYHVFLDNFEALRPKNIIFTKPYGAEDEVGRDWLIRQDSQYAHFNSKHLMEKLRGVWEANEEEREEIASGSIQISLFDKDGVVHSNFALEVSLEKLDALIEERINRGVTQFFSTLKNSFDVENSLAEIQKIDEMNIFLAGNSCKSPVVLKLFKKHIDALYSKMTKDGKEIQRWLKVYPPLGSEQAIKIQEGILDPDIDAIIMDIEAVENMQRVTTPSNTDNFDSLLKRIKKPNGKTGVAFGLLDTRVRVVQNESAESVFKYYLGQNRKKKFKCIIDKDNQKYGEWKRFCSATVETFDIWFTRSANAPSNTMKITEIGIYSETGFIDTPSEEKSVFIRLVSPSEIEYTISELTEEVLNHTNVTQEHIEKLTLQEK